jgi:hypothetical protein
VLFVSSSEIVAHCFLTLLLANDDLRQGTGWYQKICISS